MTNDSINRPLALGGLLMAGRLVLAPMAGYTDEVMRGLCRRFGAALTYTEMISAKGLLMGEKSAQLLAATPGDHPLAAQLFGSEAESMVRAAQLIEQRFSHCVDMIDLNMGCPAHKIVRSGEGSALLTDRAKAQALLSAVVKGVSLPVSVKIRKGFYAGDDVAAEFARMAADCGAVAITVHGRTQAQGYAGTADWEVVARVKQAVGDQLVVIGNGDVDGVATAKARLEQTGCDAVMIGRAAVGRPWVFQGETPSYEQRLSVIEEHLDAEVHKYGEAMGVAFMRKILASYLVGLPGVARARTRLFGAQTQAEVLYILREVYA